MITYDKFLGLNNVDDPTRLKPGEMLVASNVDIAGTLLSRRGRELLKAGGAHSLHESTFGLLAVVDNDLLLLDDDGTEVRTVYETIGYTRVWFEDLPDGRVAFSNGLISGLATATETTAWGLPAPPDAGVGIAGDTPYMVTFVRSSDGRESAPTYGTMSIDTTQWIIGLPTLPGYTLNVYLAPYGEAMFLAGNTATDTWTPTIGEPLGPQFVGGVVEAPPVGTVMEAWHGRILIADGTTLWATRPLQPDLCDRSRDFVRFEHAITLLYGTGAGVFVGTEKALHFLAGGDISDLQFRTATRGRVTKGSAVEIDTAYLPGDFRSGRGALCIVGGVLTLLTGAGQAVALTAARYQRDLAEVVATTRLRDGTLQYLASPV